MQQVWAILADVQAQAFTAMRYQSPSDPAANIAMPPQPVREDLQLPPATYALPVDYPASASEIRRDYRLRGADIARELRTVAMKEYGQSRLSTPSTPSRIPRYPCPGKSTMR